MSEPNGTWQSALEEACPDMSAMCVGGIPAVTGEPDDGRSVVTEPRQPAPEDRAPSEMKRKTSAASRKSGSGQSQASRRSANSKKSVKSAKADRATTEPPNVVSGSAAQTTASVTSGWPVPHMETTENPALDTAVSLEFAESNMSQLSANSMESKATAKSTGTYASVSSKLSKSSAVAKSFVSRLSTKLVAGTAVGAGAGMAATATTSPAAENSMNIAKALEDGTDLEGVNPDDVRDDKETVDMSDDGSSKKCEEGGGAAALAAVTAALSAVAASMSFQSASAGSTTAHQAAAVGAEGVSRDIGGGNFNAESNGRFTRVTAFLQGMSASKKKAMAIALTAGFLGIMGLSIGLGLSSGKNSSSMGNYCPEDDRRVMLAEKGHSREQRLRREDGDLEKLSRRRLIRELTSDVMIDVGRVKEEHVAATLGGRKIRQRRMDSTSSTSSKSSKGSKWSKACAKSGKGSKSKQAKSSLSFSISMSMSMNMCMSLPAATPPPANLITSSPITASPTAGTLTSNPTKTSTSSPVTAPPTVTTVTSNPTKSSTSSPVTTSPTVSPETSAPTKSPITAAITPSPSRSPTTDCPSASNLPPSSLPPLEPFAGVNATSPLGNCQGDCLTLGCQTGLGLTCYKIYNNGPDTVPGCSGAPTGTEDYCAVVPDNYLNFITGSPGTGTLARCQANCDSDSDCAGGLQCWMRGAFTNRTALEPVPGCCGLGRRSSDYCYDLNDDQAGVSTPSSELI